MSHSEPRQVLLKDTEAAEFLRLSPSTLRQHRCYGRGPAYVKMGSRVFYRHSDLVDFVESNMHRPGIDAAGQ